MFVGFPSIESLRRGGSFKICVLIKNQKSVRESGRNKEIKIDTNTHTRGSINLVELVASPERVGSGIRD